MRKKNIIRLFYTQTHLHFVFASNIVDSIKLSMSFVVVAFFPSKLFSNEACVIQLRKLKTGWTQAMRIRRKNLILHVLVSVCVLFFLLLLLFHNLCHFNNNHLQWSNMRVERCVNKINCQLKCIQLIDIIHSK